MRVTFTMAEIADTIHMTMVSRNSHIIKTGVVTTGSAESAVDATTTRSMHAASRNPITALSNAWQMMTW